MNSEVSSLRNEYLKSSLDEKDVSSNPFDQFQKWFDEVLKSEVLEPNAMVLSTVDSESQPKQRTVLLKDFSESGFTFFTNYKSNKGLQIEGNQNVSILFPWYQLQRQVIVTGIAKKIPRTESQEYFQSRPFGSQIGAWVSNQSERLSSRKELEDKLSEAEKTFEGKKIPLPENWGGYLIKPTVIEFWQGRASRLHDRILFEKGNESWQISRLSP